jgi:hypothetical protein
MAETKEKKGTAEDGRGKQDDADHIARRAIYRVEELVQWLSIYERRLLRVEGVETTGKAWEMLTVDEISRMWNTEDGLRGDPKPTDVTKGDIAALRFIRGRGLDLVGRMIGELSERVVALERGMSRDEIRDEIMEARDEIRDEKAPDCDEIDPRDETNNVTDDGSFVTEGEGFVMQGESGQRGRPLKHEDAAARQRAYRERKKGKDDG